MAIFEGAFFLGFAPEDFVIAVRVERWIDVDQIHASIGQFGELVDIIAAIDDAGVEQRRRASVREFNGRWWNGRGFFCHLRLSIIVRSGCGNVAWDSVVDTGVVDTGD